MITQSHRGTELRSRRSLANKLLCASVPLCEILLLVGCTSSAHLAALADDALPSPAPPAQETEKSWPLGRGNALAQGVANTTLPTKPEVVWKIQIDNGAWSRAKIEKRGDPYAWLLWSFDWTDAVSGAHTLVSRAIDSEGHIQPTEVEWRKMVKTARENNSQWPRKIKF